jgi:hypothetical protein
MIRTRFGQRWYRRGIKIEGPKIFRRVFDIPLEKLAIAPLIPLSKVDSDHHWITTVNISDVHSFII